MSGRRGLAWAGLSAVLVLALPSAAGAAEIVTSPAALRIGVPATLALRGADPAAEYSAYAELRGRPCVRDQSAWQIGVADPGRVAVFPDSASTFVPTARVVRLCAYTLVRPDDGSVPTRTFLTERVSTLAFSLPRGRTPLPLIDRLGDALSPVWSPSAASLTSITLSCRRKRFTLARRIPIGPDWTFAASGAARPDNSANYDVPIPPRYGGRASLAVQGAITTVSASELRLTVRVTFRAPGLRRTPGLSACRQGTRTFRTTFRVS